MTAGEEKLNLEKTALLLCDLQNDFLHPDGAYGRNGMSKPEISALPDRLKPVADKIRSKNGWVISTHFTLVEGKNGTPFISESFSIKYSIKRGMSSVLELKDVNSIGITFNL